jgi:hypothetical protein
MLWRTYWELMATHWELKGNIVQTHWELGRDEPPPSFPAKLEKKKARHLECMLGPSYWLHEISLPKRVCHHFWPGLIPFAKSTLPTKYWIT